MNIESNLEDSSADVAAAIAAASAPVGQQPIDTSSNDQLPPSNGQTRGADGRFVASSAAPDGQRDPTTGGSPAPTADGQPGAATGAPDPTQPAAPAQPAAVVDPNAPQVFDKAKPPSAWTPEMKAKWESVPEDIRAEITRREEASYQGFEKFRKQVEPATQLFDYMQSHEDYFNHIGKPAPQYLQEMIQSEQMLTLGNPAQKFELLLDIADGYGIPMRQIIDQAMGGGLADYMAEGHRNFKTPAPLPPEVQRELEESRQFRASFVAEQTDRQMREMMANTAQYPLFDEAREKMADALERGQAKDMAEAYDFVVWRDPDLRAKDQALRNGQAQQQAITQRQAAAAAVSSPNPSAAASRPKTESDETTEDTVRRALMQQISGGGRA